MLYKSTKDLLVKIVQLLEAPGDVLWDDQIESGKECLYELYQMTRPSFQGYRVEVNSKWPTPRPNALNVNGALLHAKTMVSAIRRRDRAVALISGKAAVAAM